MPRHGPTQMGGGYISSPRQFGKNSMMEQMKLDFAKKPKKPKRDRIVRDPKKLTLNYEWIEKIVTFKLSDNVHKDDPTVWMTERQHEKFKEFQREVRQMARSGEWGDYATVEVDPELYGIVEDILGISFESGVTTTCYNCAAIFDTMEELDAHEAECGL